MRIFRTLAFLIVGISCISTNARNFIFSSYTVKASQTSSQTIKKTSPGLLNILVAKLSASSTEKSNNIQPTVHANQLPNSASTNKFGHNPSKKSITIPSIEASNHPKLIEVDVVLKQFKARGEQLFQNILHHPRFRQLQQALHLKMNIPTQQQKKKKVLILMSDTGGGHRASAQAIEQALHVQFPHQFLVEIMDLWTDHGTWPYNRFVPLYRYLAKHPLLWKGCYAYGTFPVTRKLQEWHSWRTCHTNFQQAIEKAQPDCVISVHPLCQYIPLYIVEEMNQQRQRLQLPRIPFITIVTDLGGGHKTWFDKRVDACYVPSKAMESLALQCGIPAERIILKGLPIRPAFWLSPHSYPQHPPQESSTRPSWKDALRKKLGLAVNPKTILLMGGGDGVGNLPAIATHLYDTLSTFSVPSQLVVICGHNQIVKETLSRQLANATVPIATAMQTSSTSKKHRCEVSIQGFVQNMHEYMLASDCLITKAGPGTIAESMICGLPIILSSFLPGQEAGNVPYVVNGGFGVYTGPSPTRITKTVCDWIRHDDHLSAMSIQAKRLSHPKATISIAKEIGESILSGRSGTISSQQYMQE